MKILMLLLLPTLLLGSMPDKKYGLHVSDFVDSIPSAIENKIERQLIDYNKQTSIEIAVAVVADLNGTDKSQYTTDLFNKWKIGKSETNNGLLIMWCPSERAYFACTGYGLEGDLPDATLHEMEQKWVPYLKAGRGAEGLSVFVDDIIAKLGTASAEQRALYLEARTKQLEQSRQRTIEYLGFGLLIACAVVFWVSQYNREKKKKIWLKAEQDNFDSIPSKINALIDKSNRLADVPGGQEFINRLSTAFSTPDQTKRSASLEDLTLYNATYNDNIAMLENKRNEIEQKLKDRNTYIKQASIAPGKRQMILNNIEEAIAIVNKINTTYSPDVWKNAGNYTGSTILSALNNIPSQLTQVSYIAGRLKNAADSWDLVAARKLSRELDETMIGEKVIAIPSAMWNNADNIKSWLASGHEYQNALSGAISTCRDSDVSSGTKNELKKLQMLPTPNSQDPNPFTEKDRVTKLISALNSVKNKAKSEISEAEDSRSSSSRTTSTYSNTSSISISDNGYTGGGGMSGGGGAGGNY